jgi:hypothetical protein
MDAYGVRDYGQRPGHYSKGHQGSSRLKPGDRVKFFIHPDGTVVLLPKIPVSALRDIVYPRRRPITVEEMNAAVAEGAAGLSPPKRR